MPPNALLGLVTIGQAPRTDVLPDLLPILNGHGYVEHGALDPLSCEEIAALMPEPDEAPLVSRLRNGDRATMSHRTVRPHLDAAIDRCVADGAAAVLIMCTGHFEVADTTAVPVHAAEPLAQHAVLDHVGDQPFGVIAPIAEQIADVSARWHESVGRSVPVTAADPYTASQAQIVAAGQDLARAGVGAVVLDCFGYSVEMGEAVRAATGLPVLVSRVLATRAALDLVR